MRRITIEVSDTEHKLVKAKALLQGKTMKDFILDSTLGREVDDEEAAMTELLDILQTRSANAKQNGTSKRTVDDIFQSVCERKGIRLNG